MMPLRPSRASQHKSTPRVRKSLWLPADVALSLESLAKESGATQSEIVASALRLYLGDDGGKREDRNVGAVLCDVANRLSSLARHCRTLPKQENEHLDEMTALLTRNIGMLSVITLLAAQYAGDNQGAHLARADLPDWLELFEQHEILGDTGAVARVPRLTSPREENG